MARKREIKPTFYADEDLAECSVWARLLFPALWQLADREGRLEDRPAFIRIHAFPYDNLESLGVSVHACIEELARPRKRCPSGDGFVQRYVVDGRAYIQIKNFSKHQRPHPKETDSVIPPPQQVDSGTTLLHPSSGKGEPRSGKGLVEPGLQSLSSLSSYSLETTDTAAVASVPSVPPFDPDDTATAPGAVTASEGVALAESHVLAAPLPWNREAAELWWHEYKGKPTEAGFFAPLKSLVKRYGWERIRPALVTYMAETPIDFVNIAGKFGPGFGTWEERSRGAPRAGAKRSTGDRTVEAMREFSEELGDHEIGVLSGARQIGGGSSGDVGRPDADGLSRGAGGRGRS